MTSRIKNAAAARVTPDPGMVRITAFASLVSMAAFFYYMKRGDILLMGDAVAHINIARRVFDSLTPGPLQLGTVWLPLPHLLMAPFLAFEALWQNGAGGSIPSMVAYVFAVAGMLRLVRVVLESDPRTQSAAGVGSRMAAFAFGANPNLIYVQTTALTEPLYLAFAIWALVFVAEFSVRLKPETPADETALRSLWRCATCTACAELTRYDGWFLAVSIGIVVTVVAIQNGTIQHREAAGLRRATVAFLALLVIAPLLWLAYNKLVYGNALEFANGPYSAQAIEQRVGAPYPGRHTIAVAALYFLKASQLTVAVGRWGRLWLGSALLATIFALRLRSRTFSVIFVLLWSPLAFYSLSIAYGSVPLHVPMWWPFAILNQRFGLELLPLLAVSVGVLVAGAVSTGMASSMWKAVPVLAALAMIIASYVFVWRAQPLCWEEASRNWELRRGVETSVQRALGLLPPDSRYLMDLDEHVGIMERMGIPLRQVVNNENHRQWRRPSDPEGLWERALANPGKYVNYVIAFEGDLVDQHVNRNDLTLLAVIHSLDSPPVRIYETRLDTNQFGPNQSR
jgi:hypothetical protein